MFLRQGRAGPRGHHRRVEHVEHARCIDHHRSPGQRGAHHAGIDAKVNEHFIDPFLFIDSDGAAGPLAYPCCASNWYGAASPALPAPGATLADGFYRIEFAWPSEFSQPVNATVRRFEQCSVLPAGSCEDNGGVPYADDELGVDDAASFELSLVFDDQLHVVLGGFTVVPDGSTRKLLQLGATRLGEASLADGTVGEQLATSPG